MAGRKAVAAGGLCPAPVVGQAEAAVVSEEMQRCEHGLVDEMVHEMDGMK